MADSNDIQEGFLCPICHKDMRSPHNLISHFQDRHSEEQEFLKSLKGNLVCLKRLFNSLRVFRYIREGKEEDF